MDGDFGSFGFMNFIKLFPFMVSFLQLKKMPIEQFLNKLFLNGFHFYKKSISKRYELRGLHDIDMGIATSHFELTSLQNGLTGSWIKHKQENVNSIDDLQYIMTWKCE